jgi:cytochrome c oxidase assembly protein subunit 15
VVDWPNSYGYNMFLYPLSRMTGGIYYEHVHRLLGSLVGLTTLVLAIHLQRIESRPWVKRLALVALLAVVVQGLLGGLRVTGHFTMSASASETAPNLTLAVVHGIWGQLFFGLMVGLAVVTSAGWRDAGPMEIRPSAALDRALSRLLVGLLMIQLMLGAILRHESSGLMIHVSMAVIVILLTITVAVRTWGLHQRSIQLRRLGPGLIALVVLQLILGVAALIARGPVLAAEASSPADVFVRTAHQGTGALLLACSVALMLWIHRLARPR